MDMLLPQPRFPAMLRPTSDFQAVRDGRQTAPMYVDIDLATARTAGTSTCLELPIAGNVLYFDQRPGSGIATIYLENDDRNDTPLTVFAGFKAKIPFTRIYVENAAQPGLRLRLVYGVDIDLEPGIGAGVSVLNPVAVQELMPPATSSFRHFSLSVPVVAIGNAVTNIHQWNVNTAGAVVKGCFLSGAAGAGGTLTIGVYVANNAWPGTFASYTSGLRFLAVLQNYSTTIEQLWVPMNVRIPPSVNLGVFYSAAVATGGAEFGVEWELP